MTFDIFAIMVILGDLFVSGFLIWRATDKKATLWGATRIIYWYIALLTIYHAIVYIISTFFITIPESEFIYKYLHPIVFLYIVNPVLIAIIHWRGGHIIWT